ncbi:MAG TPA: glycosyltransferase family 2 protein [Candidatus Sulfotelmatobacter sp.]|nr:glycosyltransferase family 2 protein [Candidatus Sulfotelmatobacter sp.]
MKWLFWGAAAFLTYIYAGYVGWLWLRVHMRRKPVLRVPQQPHISIVMVVRNEEGVLERKLQNLLGMDYPPELCQILVVSDGSTDRTEEILREHSRDPRVRPIMKQIAAGKACGLNDAVALAGGEVIVFMDARQEIELDAVRLLVENFADREVGCVSGELMLGDRNVGEAGNGMGLYWRIEKKIREMEAASGSVVGATGALYAARRELVPSVPQGIILDDVFVPLEIARQGKRVIFDSRARAWDTPNLGADREFARKVRTLTGNYQLVQLAPWLLGSSNPLRFEFVSHKLLRLLVPFALAGILVASISLQAPFYRTALILQVLFYGLSLLGWLHVSRGPLARISDAALTFVVLNTAAAVAFMNFVTGRKAVWIR